MTNPPTVDAAGLLGYSCPRCGNEVSERFYGPCEQCREQLTETMGANPSGDVQGPSRYEPKMNVVPNFVATKDDLDDFEPDAAG